MNNFPLCKVEALYTTDMHTGSRAYTGFGRSAW